MKLQLTLFVLMVGLLVGCTAETAQVETVAVGTPTGPSYPNMGEGASMDGPMTPIEKPPLNAGLSVPPGALLAAPTGMPVNANDHELAFQAMSGNPTYKTSTWSNEAANARYSIVPVSSKMTIKGNPDCRRFRSTTEINDSQQNIYGTACMQPDGTWVAASGN